MKRPVAAVFDPEMRARCFPNGLEGSRDVPQRRAATRKTRCLTQLNTGWYGMV